MKTVRYIHSWESGTTNMVFTTIPMIHIGSEEYYDIVSKIINEQNLILEEGIPIAIDSEIGTYNKIAHKVGLVTQGKYLRYDDDMFRINIDIDVDNFKNALSLIPKKDLFRIRLFKYILMFVPAEKIKEYIKIAFAYSEDASIKLINPYNHYSYKHNKTPLDVLITTTRNDSILNNLQKIIDENKDRQYRYDIGITFGDDHMPFIYKKLQENGFSWKLREKVVVFNI